MYRNRREKGIIVRLGSVSSRIIAALLLLALLASCGLPRKGAPAATPGDETPTEQPAGTGDDPSAAGTPQDPSGSPPGAAGPGDPAAGSPGPPTVPSTPTLPPTTSPLAKNRLVTFYGHPNSQRMGVLGEYDPEEMIRRLKKQAAAYTALDPQRPALCTIELIASVAQGSPGPQNLWLLRTSPAQIEQYAQLAEKHGCLLLLDIQIGYDTVANDIKAILPFLQRPYVHLAIDPEFHVKPGQQPGEHYGSVSAAEVMSASQTLADLVVQYNLPDKVLVLHQFRSDMVTNKEQIRPIPHVDLVVVMDGWGTPGSKINNYRAFIAEELIQYGGVKLFYQQDEPLMTPEEVLALQPMPLVIIFQ